MKQISTVNLNNRHQLLYYGLVQLMVMKERDGLINSLFEIPVKFSYMHMVFLLNLWIHSRPIGGIISINYAT